MLGWENHNFAIITVRIGSGNVIKSGMQKLGESFDEEEAIYMVLKCTPPAARLLINSKRKYSNSAVNKSSRMFDWMTGIDWIKVNVTNETRWSRGDAPEGRVTFASIVFWPGVHNLNLSMRKRQKALNKKHPL